MRRRVARSLAVPLSLFLLVTSCSYFDDTDDGAIGTDGEAGGTDGALLQEDEALLQEQEANDGVAPIAGVGPSGTLRMASSIAVNSLNPHDDQTPATFSFYNWTYEGLVRQAADGSFTPWLAESWDVSDDGLTATFALHQGITFSDGAPFNADAVKASLDYVKTGPEDQVVLPVAGQLANVTDIEVLDDYHVALHLAAPGEIALISWLSRNSGLIVSPNSLGQAATAPVGTGPYVFNAQDSAADLNRVVFDANTSYWQPDLVGLERVEIDVLPDGQARKQAFEAGQYDMVVASLPLGEPTVGRSEIGPSTIISFTVIDWQGEVIPQLADRDVRCAMAEALNREGLVAEANSPQEAVRYQWAGADGDYAWIEDLSVPSFDIEGAKAAFAETGASGFSFSNGYLPGTAFETVSVAWGGALNELGITMENEALDPPSGGEMFGAFGSGRYPIQVIPINEPHPLMTLQQRAVSDGTLNPSGSVPDGVEELVQSAMTKNNEEAEADIEAAWKIMLEECIWIPWFTLYDGYWYQDNVTGIDKIPGIPIGLWPQGVRLDGVEG